MYKEIAGDEARYIHNVVEEYNKDSVLLLRVYRNELDYENNVYTEIDGSKVTKLVYDHSINSNNYINLGDVCSACIELNLITKGYSENRALIELFKEFTIIKPYILQTGSQKGATEARLVKIINQTDFDLQKENDELDTTLHYVTYTISDNDYEYGKYYRWYNSTWQELQGVNDYNEVFNSFPLGKFYVSNLYTNDYYRNLKVTAYDILGFSDICVGDIANLKPDINYTDQKGLVNYFLYKSSMVMYDEGDDEPYCDFPTYCSLKLGFGHALVSKLPKKGAYHCACYFVLVGDGTAYYRDYKWNESYEEWLPCGANFEKTTDTSIMANKIYFYDADNTESVVNLRQVKNPVASELSTYYEVTPVRNGSYSTFDLFYPSDSVSVRTLISYLAQLGTDSAKVVITVAEDEDVYNACIDRKGDLKFVKYNLIKYRDGQYSNIHYNIKYDQMLGLSLDGMPNEKVSVGQARCTSYIVDEEMGDSVSVRSIGKNGSSLDLAFPAHSPYMTACYALEQLLLIANPQFPEGTQINKITIRNGGTVNQGSDYYSKDWIASLDYVQELRLVDMKNCDSTAPYGFYAYRCILDGKGNYYWTRYYNFKVYSYLSGQVTWFGDLNLECGDCIEVTDELYNDYSFPIMSMRIEYDGSVKQILTAKGSTVSNVMTSQNISGSNSLTSLMKNNYNLIQNGIKKVKNGEYAGADRMALLVDDADLDIPTCLILSEYSMNNKNHNWLTEGRVVRIDIDGIHKSTSGFRGNYVDVQTF